MSTQPSVSVPASFSEAARAIVAAKRPLWQYELLGQILSDSVERAVAVQSPEPAGNVAGETTFPSFGNYCLDLVERLASNLESMNPVIAKEVNEIAQGSMPAYSRVAAGMGETYLRGRRLAQEAAGLPIQCAEMMPRPAWRRELESHMAKVKADLCDMAAQSLLIYESIGDSILARVRQTQKRALDEEGSVLDLNLRFSFESDTFNDHLQDFINCLDVMNMALDAKARTTRLAAGDGSPRPGKIYLYQSLFDPDMVIVTVGYDGEQNPVASPSTMLLQSYVCIREARVYDVHRAEACVRSLFDAHQAAGAPATYQIPAAEASEIVHRVTQLYSLPSMS
jgi:hypothetical protein